MKSWAATEKLSMTSQSPSEATIRTSTAVAKTKAKKRKIWQKGSKRYEQSQTEIKWLFQSHLYTAYCKINFFGNDDTKALTVWADVSHDGSIKFTFQRQVPLWFRWQKNVQNAMLAIAISVRKCISWCRFCSFHLLSPFPFLDFTRTSASELKPCECACRSPRDRDMLMDGQAWAATSEPQWPNGRCFIVLFMVFSQFDRFVVEAWHVCKVFLQFLTCFHAVSEKSLACSSLLVIVHSACRIGWLSNGDDLLAPVSKACCLWCHGMQWHATCAQPVPRFVRCGSVLLAARAYGPCQRSV